MTIRGSGVGGFAKGKAFVVVDSGQRNPYEDIPPGSVLVARTVFLADSVMINFNNVVAMVLEEEERYMFGEHIPKMYLTYTPLCTF